MSLEKYKKLKEQNEKDQADAQRAEGKLEGLMEQLRAHGYETVKEARAAVLKMEADLAKLQTETDEELAEFQERYKEQLDGD